MVRRKHFEQDLEELKNDVLKMGSMVEERINQAVNSLVEQDIKLANHVIDNDDDLDEYEVKIEQKCIKLLALQQPVAKDLRTIDMISKIATDLERMGDLAQNIAIVASKVVDEKLIKSLIDLPRMKEVVISMIRDSLEAFVELDVDKAREAGLRDDKVDNLDRQIFRELLTYMMEDPRSIRQGNNLIFVSRYLERTGDHATNICEKIIYMATADWVNY